MKKNILTLALALLFCIHINAQSKQIYSNIHFKVDEYNLDNVDYKELNDLINQLQSFPYYELKLSAHTDADASNNYNQQLSQKRANSVLHYLVSKGINKNQIHIEWYGENKPKQSNTNEKGKAENRRVEIEVNVYEFKNISDIFKEFTKDYNQTFKLKQGDNIIQGKNGTTINIPKDALVDENGNAVSYEKVTLTLQEYQNPKDAYLNQLSTISEGKILESGGMFYLKAEIDNKELKVKEGSSLKVDMPSQFIKTDMELFTGVKNENNNTIEWIPTNNSFAAIPKNKIKDPHVNLDVDYLKTLLKKTNPNFHLLKTEFKLPKISAKPLEPKKPTKFKMYTENDLLTPFQRKFYSQKRKNRILKKENNKLTQAYDNKMKLYERKMLAYNNNLIKYQKDSVKYKQEIDSFYAKINNEIENLNILISNCQIELFNDALTMLINRSNNNLITNANFENLLYSNYNQQIENKLNGYRYIHQIYSSVKEGSIQELYKFKTRNNTINFSTEKVMRNITKTNHLVVRNNSSQHVLIDDLIQKNETFKTMVKNANYELLEKRKELGLLDIAQLTNTYSTNISNLGYINCDRFSNTQLVTYEIEASAGADVKFYVKDMNSMLAAYKSNNSSSFTVSLPKGKPITLLVIELKDNQPYFQRKDFVVGVSNKLKAQTYPISIKNLNEEIQKL